MDSPPIRNSGELWAVSELPKEAGTMTTVGLDLAKNVPEFTGLVPEGSASGATAPRPDRSFGRHGRNSTGNFG